MIYSKKEGRYPVQKHDERGLMGTLRYAPPFAATTYSQFVDSEQYVIAEFKFGHGPIEFSNVKIGSASCP